VHLPSRDFASFADQGWLEPLDDRLGKTDIPATWPPLQSEMKWSGKTQGVLLMGYGGILFYNDKMLKDAKVAVPTTPDQWLAAMKATTDAGKGQFGLSTITAEHPNMVVEMASWVIGSGADWLKGGKYNFTDPAVGERRSTLWRQSVGYAPKGTNSATGATTVHRRQGRVPSRRPVGVGRGSRRRRRTSSRTADHGPASSR
jgi:multiple sugar transport system substrate-binding protein